MTVALIGITQPYIGTHAERLAMSVTGLKAGYKFGESDTGICYMLDGTGAWVVDPFVEAGALRALIGTPAGASVSADIAAIEAEVQTTSLATGAGSVATLSRAGLLLRWIADALNSGTSGLAALLAAIVGVETTTKRRQAARLQTFQYHCTSAANAGDVVAATFTAQDCDIKALNVRSNGATTADLTSIAVFGGTGKVITFIAAVDGIRANIAAADQQVGWQTNGGVITLPATHTIVITLAGTGATAVDLTMTIEYVATTDGGYLA